MNVILLILWIFWACCWMALLGLGALALMGVIELYDFLRGLFIAWRNRRKQRQLDEATDLLMRIGFLENERQAHIVRNPTLQLTKCGRELLRDLGCPFEDIQ